MRGRAISRAVQQAEQVLRNYSVSQGEGVTIPTWLLTGGIGLVVGMVIGPSLMAATKEGSERLAELSKEYIRR